MSVLEIGCGKNKCESSLGEVIGLDIFDLPGVDVVHDLNKVPYPFSDNEFQLIIANHVLEHLDNLIGVMKELYRILKPNGLLRIIVPYFSSASAHQDPTHKRFFTLRTFDYFTPESEYNYYSDIKFKFIIVRKTLVPYESILNKIFINVMNKYQLFYESHFSGVVFPKEIEFILKK